MKIGWSNGLDFASSVYNRAHSSTRLQRDIEKLSTGKRINRAADDAAGLSISQKLTAQIRGNTQAKKNIGDGLSMLQTIEASLSTIQDDMQRIRELMVLAANDTNSSSELDAMQREVNELMTNIDQIARNTEFNGHTLIFNNWTTAFNRDIQTGANDGQAHTVRLMAGPASVPDGTGVEIAILDGNNAFDGELNQDLGGIRFGGLHLNGATVNSFWSTTTNNSTSRNVNITLDEMDIFLRNVSRMRTFIGTEQNRLESSLDSLDVTIENQQASLQRVEDLDIAKATSSLTRHQIQQNSTALILGQAQNIQKDIILNIIP